MPPDEPQLPTAPYLMNKTHADILLRMINAALKGGEAIMNIYSKGYNVYEKEDLSPVTEADLASDAAIAAELSDTGIPILSEENEKAPYSIRKQWKQLFIVDPLDGTKEFINHTSEFGVCIAFVEGNTPISGVIYLPVTHELFFSTEGMIPKKSIVKPGDTFNTLEEIPSQILPLETSHDTYTILASKSTLSELMRDYLDKENKSVRNSQIIFLASCVKYCRILEGKADEYTRYGAVMEWDTAAGDALLRSVGIPLRSIATGEPLQYNKETLTSADFFVKKTFAPEE